MTMFEENYNPETTQEQTMEQTQSVFEAPVFEPTYSQEAPVSEPAYTSEVPAKAHLNGKQITGLVTGGMAAGWLAKTLVDKVKSAVKEKMADKPKTKVVPQWPFRAPFKKVVVEEPTPETPAAGEANAPAPNQEASVANESQTPVTDNQPKQA